MRNGQVRKGAGRVNAARPPGIGPGPLVLRPEQPADGDFLYALFRSHTLPSFDALPADGPMRENLVRMQFDSQTRTYRARYPDARFDIIERDGLPIGRLVVDADAAGGCIVDIALLPDRQGAGLGTAILSRALAELAVRCRVVRCQVLWNNEQSLRMCRRAGFADAGEEPPFVKLEWRPR